MTQQDKIEEITRRLAAHFHPERIYIFGSVARGDAGLDSDLDFCVVLPDGTPESFYRDRSVHSQLRGLEAAVDIVRLPASDFDARAAHVVASLPATILREGQLLYDARRIAA